MSGLRPLLTLAASIVCLNIDNAPPRRLAGRIDNARRVVLAGRVHSLARAQNDLGKVDGAYQMLAMTLLLKPGDSQGLNQLLQAQQVSSSPNFHKLITRVQFGDFFGASSADID